MATEALKVALTAAMSNSEVDLLTVASGHTVAVLSVLLCETGAAAEEDGEGEGGGEEGEEKYFTNAERGATSVNLGWPSQPNGERKRDGDELLRPPSPCGY